MNGTGTQDRAGPVDLDRSWTAVDSRRSCIIAVEVDQQQLAGSAVDVWVKSAAESASPFIYSSLLFREVNR